MSRYEAIHDKFKDRSVRFERSPLMANNSKSEQ